MTPRTFRISAVSRVRRSHRPTAAEAAQTNAALDALEAAIAGEQDLGPFFADLVDREPALPEHLRGEP